MVTCLALIRQDKNNIMDKILMERGCLIAINVNESTQIRGGISWEAITRFAIIIKHIANFILDYGDEMKNGFNDGWESVKM